MNLIVAFVLFSCLRSLIKWDDVPCREMFPKCNKDFGSSEENKKVKEDSKVEEESLAEEES